MRHLVDLRLDRVVNLLFSVPMHRHPEGGNSVEIFFAVDVEEPISLAALDDERGLFLIIAHLREGVPEVLTIRIFEIFYLIVVHNSPQKKS